MTRKGLYFSVAAIALAAFLRRADRAGAAPSRRRNRPSRSTPTTSAARSADPKGPEAGVWVIAETTDLPTRFTKSVVTDDQGRYVIPDLPTANYQVWVRGYGLVDSPKMRAKPGQHLDLTAVPAPSEAAAAHYYPAIYWYTMMKIPPAKDFGGLDRHSEEHHARQLAQADEQHRLHRLPSARPGGDPHDPGAVRQVQVRRRRLDAPHPVRPVRRDDDQPHRRPVRRRAVQVFRRLDRPRRQGRTAEEQAAAAARRRAQSRRHHVGVVDARQVHARPDLVGPAQSDGQRQRPAVRLAGIFDRQQPDPRSEDQHGVVLQDAGGRSGDAGVARTGPCGRGQAARAVGLLGRQEAVGHARQQAQRDVRQGWPRLARRDRARHGQSGLVQEGLGQPVRQGLPDRESPAPGRGARSQDQGVRVHRHLLRHPPSAVRLRRRQHAVDVAAPDRWPAGSTPRCSTRPATRRRRSAGPRSCSTPTATASSTICRARQAGGGQGHAHQSRAPAPMR